MKKEIQNPFSDESCSYFKRKNFPGLKLKFFWNEIKKEMSSEYVPLQHFRDQGTILHGGIQMGLLDDIIGWAIHTYTQELSAASELNLNFVHPIYIDNEKIKVTGRILSIESSKIVVQAFISNHTDVICTLASGSYQILQSDEYKTLTQDRQDEAEKIQNADISNQGRLNKPAVIKPDPLKRGIEWAIGPDQDMNWYEACNWATTLQIHGDGWRMPLTKELKGLYSQNNHTLIDIHSSFKTSGWWLWSGEEEGPLSALGLDIIRGKVDIGGRSLVSGGRVFAVRTTK